MFHQFMGRMPRIPAFFIEPTTDNAKKFVAEYGQVLTFQKLKQKKTSSGKAKVLILSTGYGKQIEVYKDTTGIFVDGVKFCDDW